MMPILQIGPISLPLPSLIIIAGIWIGFTLSERRAEDYGISNKQLGNLMLLATLFGLLGARLAYVVRYPSAFYANPLDIFSRNPGLFDFYGGILVALIASIIYIQRKNLNVFSILDSITHALAILGISIGLSHLASGKFFGIPSDLPWAINLWGSNRHPTQIYEIILAVIIFIIIFQGHRIFKPVKPGFVFLSFLALTAFAHIFIGYFRGDGALIFAGIHRDQAVAWVILAIALWGMGIMSNKELIDNKVKLDSIGQEELK
jgi:phosphatidylglycerol:prolipoprotein diacylglycerol transferase